MQSIRLVNYRCFKNTGQIELKPLNLLVGANSSGKSSLAEFFPLLQQSSGVKLDGVFRWSKEGGIDYGSFANAILDDESVPPAEREMQVEFSFKRDHSNYAVQTQTKHSEDFKVTLKIRQPKGENIEQLSELILECSDVIRLGFDGTRLSLEINGESYDPGPQKLSYTSVEGLLPLVVTESLDTKNRGDYRIQFFPGAVFHAPCADDDLERALQKSGSLQLLGRILSMEEARAAVKSLGFGDDEKKAGLLQRRSVFLNLNELLREVNRYTESFAAHLFYVKPLRSYPRRIYHQDNLAWRQAGSDVGDVAGFILRQRRLGTLKDFNDWCLKRFGFTLNTHQQDGTVSLWIQLRGERERNIVDVGFGYAQLIPIVVLLWHEAVANVQERSFGGDPVPVLFIIEQPELHLHPRLTGMFAAALGQVVREATERGLKLQLMVETHSEVMIRRICSQVRLGELDNQAVQVLMFNPEHNEQGRAQIEVGSIEQDGSLRNWPYGFLADRAY
ncbi:MAG: AAA family ATPase [Succinivibrio sp.]|nr:AAA family ATPase [Succinivibrio sp.]